jgi:dolichol-phosphate mannosyltransferase
MHPQLESTITFQTPPRDEPDAVQAKPRLLGVSVVVPMFNERECAPALIASLLELEQTFSDRFGFEFVFVDDGSSDDTVDQLTAAIAGREGFSIVRHAANRGIAAAIHTGIRAARHEIVVSMDCDLSYAPTAMADMIDRLAPGVDMVTASPYHFEGAVEEIPRWRLRLSRLASRLYGLACRQKLSCYTSCFRVYRRSVVAPLEIKNEGFVGVAELLWKVIDEGGRVAEHPAVLRSRQAGASKMRVLRAGLGHLRLIARIFVLRVAHFLFPNFLRRHPRQGVESSPQLDSQLDSLTT